MRSRSINRGLAYRSSGDIERRWPTTIRRPASTSTMPLAYYERGSVYFDKRDYDRAIADLNRRSTSSRTTPWRSTCAALPTTPRASTTAPSPTSIRHCGSIPKFAAALHQSRAMPIRRSATLDRAIADFDQAIKANPNYVVAFYSRGMAYTDKRDFEGAVRPILRKAIELDPKNAGAYNSSRLACYRNRGDDGQRFARFQPGDRSSIPTMARLITIAAPRTTRRREL